MRESVIWELERQNIPYSIITIITGKAMNPLQPDDLDPVAFRATEQTKEGTNERMGDVSTHFKSPI